MKTKTLLQLQVCLLLFGAAAVEGRGTRSSGSSSSSESSDTSGSESSDSSGSAISAALAPSGTITADKVIARAGAYPSLSWEIDYPLPQVLDIIDIEEDGTIVPKSGMTMRVRILAADVQERITTWNSYRREYEETFNYITVAGYGKINNSSWERLFYGTQPEVDTSDVVWEEELDSGDEVIFAAKAYYSNLDWYYSGEDSPNVLVLKSGDEAPYYATWDTQATLGTHISPYLDENGLVSIGPRDVIVAFELTHSMPNSAGEGDMQDMIFLLTFDAD